MESQKVLQLGVGSLLCLVVSLFYLIDMAEGATTLPSSSSLHPTLNLSRLGTSPESPSSSPSSPVTQTTTTTKTMTMKMTSSINLHSSSPKPEIEEPTSHSGIEDKGRHLFAPSGMWKKRKLTARRRNGLLAKSSTTLSPQTILSEKMDQDEFTFDGNGTLIDNYNKTINVSNNTINDTSISTQIVDPLCPDKNLNYPRGTNAQQSTLPAYEFILAVGVHLIAFVIFLYFWKTVYYPVEDPYATVSPYGFDVVTPSPLNRRDRNQKLNTVMHTLQKSITNR